jgi:hypothetical protein
MNQNNLYTKILAACNHIANHNRNGYADYIIVNSKFSDLIYNLDKINRRKEKLDKILKIINDEQ